MQLSKKEPIFQSIFSMQTLNEYIHMKTQQLLSYLATCSKKFNKKLNNKNKRQFQTFFHNYHSIIVGIIHLNSPPIYQSYNSLNILLSNDLSLHFILLYSFSLIHQNKIDDARQILKKGWNYVQDDKAYADPILLSIVLSNLSMLYAMKHKSYKGLLASMKTTQLMESWLKRFRENSQRKRKKPLQESVILINSYLISKHHLKKILANKKKAQYKELLHFIQYTGYKYSLKYLGKESVFTKQFENGLQFTDNDVYLPVFKPIAAEPKSQHNILDQQINERLNTILQILKSRKQPEVIYVEKQKQPQSSISEEEQIPDCKVLFQKKINISGQLVLIQFLQTEDYKKFGSLVVSTLQQKKLLTIINQQKLINIFKQMNLEDTKPYECRFDDLTLQEIIDYCLVPYMKIQSLTQIQIYPKCKGQIQPFSMKFLGQDSLIFVSHIRFMNFRISISPKKAATSVYLNISLDQRSLRGIVEVKQKIQQSIDTIWKTLAYRAKKKKNYPSMQNFKNTQVNILARENFFEIICFILKKFQEFMSIQQSESSMSQIIEQPFAFYKFMQIHPPSALRKPSELIFGKFYYIRYLPNLSSFDIFVQNSFDSFIVDGESKAKGSMLYTSSHFRRDFGIGTKILGYEQIMTFSDILTLKFDLKVYDKKLQSRDQELYTENALSQVAITAKSYKRKFINCQNYAYPITSSIVSINNQIPIGVRINGYNPIKCEEQGFFICVTEQSWKRPQTEQQKDKQMSFAGQASSILSEDEPIFKKHIEQFIFKNKYFLPEWMQKKGFNLILSKIILQKQHFIFEGFNKKFNRLSKVLLVLLQNKQ